MSSTTTAVDSSPSNKRAKTSCGPAIRHPVIGSQITKLFDVGGHDKWYFGKVTSYDPAAKFFKVRYTDGDEEELDEEEIDQYLAHRQHLVSSDDDEEEGTCSGREEEFDEEDVDRSDGAITDETPTSPAPKPKRGEMEIKAVSDATVTNTSKMPSSPVPEKNSESAADATVAAPSPSPSATGTSKRKRSKNTKPIEIKDHPKKDQLPGWKLRTDTNPILHISPDRKIPFETSRWPRHLQNLSPLMATSMLLSTSSRLSIGTKRGRTDET